MRTQERITEAGKGRGANRHHLVWTLLAALAVLGALTAAMAQSRMVEQAQMHELKCLFAATSSAASTPAFLQEQRTACAAAYEAAVDPAASEAAIEASEMHQLKRLFLAEGAAPNPGVEEQPTAAEQMRQLKRLARDYANGHPANGAYAAAP